MVRSLIIVVLILIPVLTWSQENQITQDPAAKEVLDRVASKTKSMKSLQADFELVIEDRKEKTKNSSAGSLLIKQNKYKVNSEGSTIYYNGTTMWTYMTGANEVTITEPDNQAGDFMSNPAIFFTIYSRDFKYKYIRETTLNGSRCHEVDLFPKNLNQPYSRIKVFVGVKSDLPEILSSVGKDGVDYTIYLKNIVLDRDVADATFTFDAAKFKKVEVVDMRGTK
jgi:outer membrane lipoprotein-sorting protein